MRQYSIILASSFAPLRLGVFALNSGNLCLKVRHMLPCVHQKSRQVIIQQRLSRAGHPPGIVEDSRVPADFFMILWIMILCFSSRSELPDGLEEDHKIMNHKIMGRLAFTGVRSGGEALRQDTLEAWRCAQCLLL